METIIFVNKPLLKSKDSVYWPNRYTQIVNMMNSFTLVKETPTSNKREPLLQHPILVVPWKNDGIDLVQLYK